MKNNLRVEGQSKSEVAEGAWNSEAEEAAKKEERSLDIGESGQFVPGSYYNQQGVNEARRTLDDDEIVPPGRNTR